MTLRFATWAAVSTKDQAKKISLKVQVEKCSAAGSQRGWSHVRDYVVPGQSRTNWISLVTAEQHIPQLHDMLEAAYRGEFDVLIVYDLNRFRSLMLQVFDALCDCNVQMFILSQPREPVPHYTEAHKREMRMQVSLNDILSNNETSQIQIHYRDKMPKRITDKGLHAGLGLPPYGFDKPPTHKYDRDAVLVQVPAEIAVLNCIKDWFFGGASLTGIADRLNAQGIPSPRGATWWWSTVEYLLANPFYAGIVGFGYTQRVRMRREGTVIRHKGTPVTGIGKHQPVWDVATHQRILADLERRGQAHPGIKTRQLSRLLYCWCGCVMWANIRHDVGSWRCSSSQRGHARISDPEAVDLTIKLIIRQLEHVDELSLPSPADKRPALEAEVRDLHARKKRWMDDYEAGDLSRQEYHERVDPLTLRIAKKQQELQDAGLAIAQSAHTRSTLEQLAVSVETLPHYYAHGPKEQVNADLHTILSKIVVGKDKSLEIVWR